MRPSDGRNSVAARIVYGAGTTIIYAEEVPTLKVTDHTRRGIILVAVDIREYIEAEHVS
jgi:hypothetical protein